MTQEQKLIAYVYGELDEKEQMAFEQELSRSPEMQAELHELKRTRLLMKSWPDEHAVPFSGIKKQESKRVYSLRSFAIGVAASLLFLTCLGWLAGAEFGYSKNEGLHIVLGYPTRPYLNQQQIKAVANSAISEYHRKYLQPQKTKPSLLPVPMIKQDIPASQMGAMARMFEQQNRRDMQSMLDILQKNQEHQLDLTLRMFAKYLDEQRSNDIRTIAQELVKIRQHADNRFDETDLALNKLFQTVQYTDR